MRPMVRSKAQGLLYCKKTSKCSQIAGTKMLVSQSIFRLLRNVVARWNQCLICGSLDHVPWGSWNDPKTEKSGIAGAIFTHLDRSFNIVHLLNPSGYGLLRYGTCRLQNFKASRCRLHTFPIFGGTDIGGARSHWWTSTPNLKASWLRWGANQTAMHFQGLSLTVTITSN